MYPICYLLIGVVVPGGAPSELAVNAAEVAACHRLVRLIDASTTVTAGISTTLLVVDHFVQVLVVFLTSVRTHAAAEVLHGLCQVRRQIQVHARRQRRLAWQSSLGVEHLPAAHARGDLDSLWNFT